MLSREQLYSELSAMTDDVASDTLQLLQEGWDAFYNEHGQLTLAPPPIEDEEDPYI